MATSVLVIGVLAQPALAPGAVAATGSARDPKDSSGPLDVAEVRHADSNDTITYEVAFHARVDPQDYDAVDWFLDFDGDANKLPELCVNTVYDPGRGVVVGEVTGANCGTRIESATVSRVDPVTYRVTWPVAALRTAGLQASSYRYDVEAFDFDSGQGDLVPDSDNFGITHQLGGGGPTAGGRPLPTPQAASPVPPASSPTAAAGPSPAAEEPETIARISRATLRPGQSAVVSGGGFAASAPLQITLGLGGPSLASAATDEQGRFSTVVQVPADAAAGSHTIHVAGPGPDGGLRVEQIPIGVVGRPAGLQPSAPAAAQTPQVAPDATGSGGANWPVVAAIVAAIGTPVLVVARSSRRARGRGETGP